MGNRLEVRVDGNSTGFEHVMQTVRTQAKGTMDSITHSWTSGPLSSIGAGLIGAFSFEGIKSSFEGFLSRAKGLADISEQLEMATDQTQKWGAAAKAVGLSFEGMEQILLAIESKREEALRDPKAADLFSMLGINRNEVLSENASDFAKHVLQAGSQNRDVLEQIIGRRGLKYAPTAKLFDEQTAPISQDDVKLAIEAAADMEKAFRAVDSIWSHIVDFSRFTKHLFTWSRKDWQRDAMQHGMRLGPYADPELLKEQADRDRGGPLTIQTPQEQMKILDAWEDSKKQATALANMMSKGASESQLLAFVSSSKQPMDFSDEQLSYLKDLGLPRSVQDALAKRLSPSPNDPLEGIRAQQEEEFKLREREAEFGLHEAQRRNMTIAERKKSIAEDLATTNDEIAARKKAQSAGLIYGMTGDQQKNLLPTDVKKQLQDDALAILGLESRGAGFTNELRENRGFSFDADSMARVGLYSAQTLTINPMLALNQQQLSALQQIERNTAALVSKNDPHQR